MEGVWRGRQPAPCKYCGKKATNRQKGRPPTCDDHARVREVTGAEYERKDRPDYKQKPSPFKDFYASDQWKELRRQVLNDHPMCFGCEAKEMRILAVEVDHIIPLRIDYERRLHYDNLQPLCLICHRQKTAKERSGEYIDHINKRILTVEAD